jgi:integrase
VQAQTHDDLFQYETVKKWINALSSTRTGSKGTQRNYLLWLDEYVDFVKKDPDTLIAERRVHLKNDDETVKRKHEETVQSFYNYLRNDRKLSPNTSVSMMACVRSFYKANYVDLKMRTPQAWVIKQSKIPTREELKRMVDACNIRDRALILLQAQSGLSSSDLVRLTYGHIREQLEQGKNPIKITMVREKEKVAFSTFVGTDAIEALKVHLAYRKSGTKKLEPEELKDDSPLMATFDRKPIAYVQSIRYIVASAAMRVGLKNVHPHALRKYFASALRNAGVNETIVEYMMGHKLPAVKKAYFSDQELEDSYKRAEPYLSIAQSSSVGIDHAKLDILKTMAKSLGLDPEQITFKARIEFARELTPSEEANLLSKELANLKNRHEEKVIRPEELELYINDGWSYVDELSSGKVIIRR